MEWILVLLTLFSPCQGNGCPKGFVRFRDTDRCYHVSNKVATFDIAQMDCKSRSSKLAPVLTIDEEVDLSSFLLNQRGKCRYKQSCMEFWIDPSMDEEGISKIKLDKINPPSPLGRPTFWARGFPQYEGDCIFMSFRENIKRGTWRDGNCNRKMKYACVTCPDGFTYLPYANTCFYLNTKKMNWNEARLACTKLKWRAQLLSIQDERKRNAVSAHLVYRYTPQGRPPFRECVFPKEESSDEMNMAWTAGQSKDPKRCDTPFMWKPIGLEETIFNYTFWGHGKPNCNGNGEFCVRLVEGDKPAPYGYMDVASCSHKLCSICEFP